MIDCMRCPTCKEIVPSGLVSWRPFCSRRCRLIDLGRWLDGEFSLPGENAGAEELDDAIEEARRKERGGPSGSA
ncbi:MAG: endogenous inhibitor of DNA gyrase (YacG/DUF329 family) [Candidatus Binatia bacterium]|jgi:endogenous inhibitor of DNA gyrase (YacG/DUF329 family)